MQTQLNTMELEQHASTSKYKNHECNIGMEFVINGCAVTFTSNENSTNEPLAAVKEILLSAYRTRTAKG